MQETNPLPMVLGSTATSTPKYQDEDENCMYLLQDCDVDGTSSSGGPAGCARALQKFCKSRPLRFLQVHKHQYPPLKERIVKLGYEPIQSQRSLKKWM